MEARKSIPTARVHRLAGASGTRVRSRSATVVDAAREMRDGDIGNVIVTEKSGEPLGSRPVLLSESAAIPGNPQLSVSEH